MATEVEPIQYQLGNPIWIKPAPVGHIVVSGVNLIIRLFEVVEFPRIFDVEVRLILETGKIAIYVVMAGIFAVF